MQAIKHRRPFWQYVHNDSVKHPRPEHLAWNGKVFALLKAGLTTACYDGQYFFDVDHPVYANHDGTGAATSVANADVDTTARPNNPIWYLMDVSRALKPLLFQKRRDYDMKAMTDGQDEAVFMSDTYRYGVDAQGALCAQKHAPVHRGRQRAPGHLQPPAARRARHPARHRR